MAPPLLLIAALPQQQRLIARFQAHLQPRGLSLTAISTKPTDQQLVAEAAALFVVVTPASLRHPEISTLYQKALQQGKIVVPLIVQFPRAMPADLHNLQWLDCTRGSDAAWQQLLLLLETMGIARWPVPPQPRFDAELVNLRSRTGRIPPDWRLFYVARTRRYRLTRRAARAAAILLTATIVGCILTHFALDVLSAGVVVTVVVTVLLSESGHTFGQRDPLLVITPQGWLQSADGQVSAFAFAQVAQLQIVSGVQPERRQLMVSFPQQPVPVPFTIAPYFNNGLLAMVIETAYQRYRSHQEPLLTSPQVFISYSHHDVAFVEIFERNLRKEGYATWLDRQTLHGGTRWQAEIYQALDQVEAVIVVISPDAMRAPEVQREYTYALAQGKRVVAVLARKTATIPPAL